MPHVQRKRKILEKEGVVFDSTGRIDQSCFHTVSSLANGKETLKGLTCAHFAVAKRNTKKSTKKNLAGKATVDEGKVVSQAIVETEIIKVLQTRELGKTC